MEELPRVQGLLENDGGLVRVDDAEMIKELTLKGYGEDDEGIFYLKPFESLYLLYTNKLVLTKKKGNSVNFDSLVKMCTDSDSQTLTRFLIYRDLRTRGYIAKDGFGFGSDFRVYERGGFGQKAAKYLIFGINEGQQEKMGDLQKKIEQISQMGKEPIIAVIERRGEVIYYKINRMNFFENKSRLSEDDIFNPK